MKRRKKLHKVQLTTSLIVGSMRPRDFERFYAARIPFSGSTGPNVHVATKPTKRHPYYYPPPAPYIATWLEYLVPVLTALGWSKVQLGFDGQQMTVELIRDCALATHDDDPAILSPLRTKFLQAHLKVLRDTHRPEEADYLQRLLFAPIPRWEDR